MSRREFLESAATAAAAIVSGAGATAAGVAPPVAPGPDAAFLRRVLPPDGPKKALLFGMLPNRLSIEDRFKLARDVGFHAVESGPVADVGEAERMRKAAENAGIRVHSVIYGGWDPP